MYTQLYSRQKHGRGKGDKLLEKYQSRKLFSRGPEKSKSANRVRETPTLQNRKCKQKYIIVIIKTFW